MTQRTKEETAARRLVVYLEPALNRRLHVEAAKRRTSLSDLVEAAVRAFLKQGGTR